MNAVTKDEAQVLELEPQQAARVPVVQQTGGLALSQGEAFMLNLLDRKLDFDQIERAMDLKDRMDAKLAEQAFNKAKAAFKAEVFVITKDRDNKQYGSRYSSIGNTVNTAGPYLSKHGFSWDWDHTQEGGKVKVTCTLSHELGHSKTAEFETPPDATGQKNPAQQIKSAITYGKLATFEAVCGLASSDANADDDGNGFTQATMQDAWVAKVEAAATLQELDAIYQGGTKAFQATKDTRGYAAFAAAGKKRSKALKEQANA